jgi:site-specific DNA recombinase
VDGGFSGSRYTERPEFKRLLADVERWKLSMQIFFTELSRLSQIPSKIFIHIFEFTQEHGLRSGLLSRQRSIPPLHSQISWSAFLWSFSEFEREITADRIRRNAYERSKRGLAYGGFEPLGYKRDPEHKGRLLIQDDEAKIVRDISQYLHYAERSLLMAISQSHQEESTITRAYKNSAATASMAFSRVKVYIGIREIKNRRRKR